MKRFVVATLLGASIACAAGAGAIAAPLTPSASKTRDFGLKLETVQANQASIEQKMIARGYRSIKFKSDPGPFVAAEACLGGEKMDLKVSRWGDIVNRRDLGKCPGSDAVGVDQDTFEIAALLESRGFTSIEFTDKEPPTLAVEACDAGRKVKLVLNKFGDIQDRKRLGKCTVDEKEDDTAATPKKLPGLFNTRASKDHIQAVLTAQGFTDIKFTGRFFFRYKVDACRGGEVHKMELNRFGEIRKSKSGGASECSQAADDFVGRKKPRQFSSDEIRGKGRVNPELCQQYFDWLLYENTVLFDKAKANIRPDSATLLSDLAYVSNRCPETSIEISGHTDNDGGDDYNQELSEKRAASVLAYLAKRGVEKDRLAAVGYGEERPVLPNSNEENKQFNRRIEFIVRWE